MCSSTHHTPNPPNSTPPHTTPPLSQARLWIFWATQHPPSKFSSVLERGGLGLREVTDEERAQVVVEGEGGGRWPPRPVFFFFFWEQLLRIGTTNSLYPPPHPTPLSHTNPINRQSRNKASSLTNGKPNQTETSNHSDVSNAQWLHVFMHPANQRLCLCCSIILAIFIAIAFTIILLL